MVIFMTFIKKKKIANITKKNGFEELANETKRPKSNHYHMYNKNKN